MLKKQEKRRRRHKKVRTKVFGTEKVPRLSVFKSNQHIYAQLIDDEKGKTLVAASNLELKTKKGRTKIEEAKEVGKLIAEKALEKKFAEPSAHLTSERQRKSEKDEILQAPRPAKHSSAIEKVVFDRGGYKYHGRIKALAEGAREGGLNF